MVNSKFRVYHVSSLPKISSLPIVEQMISLNYSRTSDIFCILMNQLKVSFNNGTKWKDGPGNRFGPYWCLAWDGISVSVNNLSANINTEASKIIFKTLFGSFRIRSGRI